MHRLNTANRWPKAFASVIIFYMVIDPRFWEICLPPGISLYRLPACIDNVST
jgi:hypothetical protein